MKTRVPVGVYGWGGYHSTSFWIDPESGFTVCFDPTIPLSRWPQGCPAAGRLRPRCFGAVVRWSVTSQSSGLESLNRYLTALSE